MHFSHRSLRPFLSLVLLLFSPTLADLSNCVPCDERECPRDLDCPGEMFFDPCGCCIKCAKELGETCGDWEGGHHGQCRQGLICEKSDWSGSVSMQPDMCIKDLDDIGESSSADSQYSSLCTATYSGCNVNTGVCVCALNLTVDQCESPFEYENRDDCMAALQQIMEAESSDTPAVEPADPPPDVCANVFCREQPVVCPWDSSAVQGPLEPGECCPPRPSCQCDLSKCSVIICIAGYEMSVKEPGDKEPGNCCDVYECIPVPIQPTTDPCASILCEEYDIFCPPDSKPLQLPRDPGECCPPPPTCTCDLTLCPPSPCTVGHQRRIKSSGTNEPGNCCDVYECMKENVTDCSGVVCHMNPQMGCPVGTKTIMGGLSDDGCCLLPSRCDCDPTQCLMPSCWDGYSPRLVLEASGIPGDCCDQYECVSNVVTEGCTHQGVTLTEGERWPVDSCKNCECRQGLSHCVVRQACYQHLCLVEGGFHEPGDRWNADDCTSCECIGGEVACTTGSCKLDCINPRYIPGICCPVCDGPTFITLPPIHCPPLPECSLSCPQGLATNTHGCPICQCRTDDVYTPEPFTTTPVICPIRECVRQSCDHGFAVDLYGCPTCQCLAVACPSTRHCLPCAFGYRFDEKGCQTCRCRKCASMDDCNKFCPYGYQRGRNNCLKCRCERCPPLERCTKECVHGRETNDRGCQICKCKNSTTSPSKPISTHECTTTNDNVYSDGESWHDGCRWCYCHDGHEMCALIACPVPQCEQPFILPDFCCPVCTGTASDLSPPGQPSQQVCHSLEGHFYVEGETWSVDSCTDCVCHNGHVLCSIQECPPLACDAPVLSPSSCCGTCSTDESHSSELAGLIPCVLPGNHFFPSGTSWKDDDCTSCQCNNGQVSCFPQSCPAVECTKPVLRKGQCCATCIDTPKVTVCEYGDEVYLQDDIWYAGACVTCTCLHGAVSCTGTECPPLDCKHTKLFEGHCCPSCIDTMKPAVESKPDSSSIPPRLRTVSEEVSTQSAVTLGDQLSPATLNKRVGSPILLIVCIALSCLVVLLLLLIIVKRKHRLLYNVNERQMPIRQPEDPAVTITAIKPKNTDVKPLPATTGGGNARDSIRDSKVFKENFANKANNVVNSKLDGYEIKFNDKYAGNKIDHV